MKDSLLFVLSVRPHLQNGPLESFLHMDCSPHGTGMEGWGLLYVEEQHPLLVRGALSGTARKASENSWLSYSFQVGNQCKISYVHHP